jgi:hypothetical protein
MVHFASTQAQAKGVAPTVSSEEGYTEAAMSRPPKSSPLPTADGADKMYHQPMETHALTASQLAECAHWHRSNHL